MVAPLDRAEEKIRVAEVPGDIGLGDGAPGMDSPGRFINRELSWLTFNERVLEEATNTAHPLLERLRFLSISASNFDEFYMVRVAGLKGQVTADVTLQSQEGMTPAQQLVAINARASNLMAQQQRVFRVLREELSEAGIEVLETKGLTPNERQWLERYFIDRSGPRAPLPLHPEPWLCHGPGLTSAGG